MKKIKEKKLKHYIQQFKQAAQHLDPADRRIKKLNIDFVRAVSRTIETRSGINKGQSKYIAKKALVVAAGLGMSMEEAEDIFYAGLLIQLGKIHLPDDLLTKPFYSMSIAGKYRYCRHAVDGADLLKALPQFNGAMTLIRHQYEQYNGQGFPDALIGRNIPLGSRIISVVSDYADYLNGSMTGQAMYADDALSQLTIRKESHYDPEIVGIFANVLGGATVEEFKAAR